MCTFLFITPTLIDKDSQKNINKDDSMSIDKVQDLHKVPNITLWRSYKVTNDEDDYVKRNLIYINVNFETLVDSITS